MQVRTRWIRTITPDVIVDPDDPSSTALTDEGFDTATSDEAPTTSNTSAASVTGSGSLTHNNDVAFGPGGGSMKLDGTAQHFLTFGADYTAHAEHLGSLYGHVARWPSADAWCVGLRDSTDAATVAQLGINSSGQFILRTGSSGAVDDTSAVSTIDTGFLFEFRTTAGQMSVSIYDAVSEVLVDTISCPVSGSTFTNDQLGLLETISGTGAAIGNLQNDDFTGTDGSAVATANRSAADAVSGSGTLTFSTTNAISGVGVRVNGLSYHMMRYDNASHSNHYVYLPWRHVTTPSATQYIWEVRAGNGTTVGAQIGITSAGKFKIRDANTGTGGATDEFSGTMTAQQYYLHGELLGAGGFTLEIYDATLTLVDTLVCTLTATNFSDERIGAIQTTTGTALVGTIDNFKSDNAAIPAGTVATGPLIYFDRFITDSATMPDRLDLSTEPPPPTYDAKLVPATGAWQGVTASNTGTKGNTTTAGYNAWMTYITERPHILCWYHVGPAWNGVLTTEQKTLCNLNPQAIIFLHWKVNQNFTWQQIANGSANATIDQVCAGLSQWPHAFFLALYHEPEDNVDTGGNTRAHFASMWRYVYNRMKSQMTAAAFGRIAFVLQYLGYSSWAGTNGANFDELYPGDDYVDWIAWDPYTHSATRNTIDELLNENISSVSGWTGHYNHWTTNKPTKPLMISEWGVDHDVGSAVGGMTDAQAAAVLTTMQADLPDFPAVKAWVYWNSDDQGIYQIQTSTAGFQDAMDAFVSDSTFNQDTSTVP